MNVEKFIVLDDCTIRTAIQALDHGGEGFIAVYRNNVLQGIITDGDIRRAILSGVDLNDCVSKIMNRDFIQIGEDYTDNEVENIFKNTKARHIPVVKSNQLIDVLFEESFFLKYDKHKNVLESHLTLPVVIMAGGKGTRLDPFTDKFACFGMNQFYVTLNHKKNLIKAFFEELLLDHQINFVEEEKLLGTIGALKYLENELNTPFFVTNCDIIVEADYTELYNFHINHQYDLTLVASMQHHVIPYGVCEIEDGGELIAIREKPQYDFLTNAGLYLIDPSVFKYIPYEEYFDITQLIDKLKDEGRKVGVFPVSEKSWHDVGQWAEYQKTLKHFEK